MWVVQKLEFLRAAAGFDFLAIFTAFILGGDKLILKSAYDIDSQSGGVGGQMLPLIFCPIVRV